MTDGILFLYVWDVEVRPEYAAQGVEKEMLRRLIEAVGGNRSRPGG
jgi:ribosomal protein S18 acetylase RimI-like enzyme